MSRASSVSELSAAIARSKLTKFTLQYSLQCTCVQCRKFAHLLLARNPQPSGPQAAKSYAELFLI